MESGNDSYNFLTKHNSRGHIYHISTFVRREGVLNTPLDGGGGGGVGGVLIYQTKPLYDSISGTIKTP